jgi:predicted O-linked N-acetylglucosamine transferase (SPINDLY family)
MTPALQEALRLHRAGRSAEALPFYADALRLEPDDLAALYYGGVAAWSAKRLDLALERLNRAIALAPQPTAEVHYHRGLVLASFNREEEAVADYQHALALKPDYAPPHNNLALIMRDRGDLAAAARHLDAALRIDPQLHDARYNRGLVAVQMGELALARTTLADCVKRDPDNAAARASLIDVLIDCAALSEALALARASAKRLPKAAVLWNALAQAEAAAGNQDAAAKAYADGLKVAPDDVVLSLNAALFESEQSNFSGAREIYTRLVAAHEHNGARFRLATLLPSIPESETQIDGLRRSFRDALARLRDDDVKLVDPLNEFGDTPFYLSYHGRDDDRQLLAELEQTLRSACPALNFTAPHVGRTRRTGKPRVAFCSHFLFDHSVGRSVRAYVQALATDQFELSLLLVPPFQEDSLSRELSGKANVIRLPFDLRAARERIATLELDLLIFPEIGMDALTYYLALSRLARVQWTTLGHPCTSGLSSIDAYLSYETLEVPGSERFYSERLIRLPEGSIYPDYPGDNVPARLRDRTQLGLPGDGPLLICPQSLFKLMPQFDQALRDILEATPQARVLLPEARHAGQVTAIKRRFAATLGPLADRIQFFSRRSRAEFIELVAACDVLLDPFPVGGGITTWDALATGIPMVTWPGELMRSRFAFSALQQAGITSTVARDLPDYVAIVSRLLRDADERATIRSAISGAAPSIYRDTRAVPHFLSAINRALDA